MKISQVLPLIVKKLKIAKINSPALDAEILLSHIIGKEKEFLYAHPEYELTRTQNKKLKKFVGRRLKYEPIAHLTGQKEFFGFDFWVNKNVLIPRPETELLVEEVIAWGQNQNERLNILDLGTGSGCIAIALKKYLPWATVTATDTSDKAISVAKKNARKNEVKIKFLRSDLMAKVRDKKFDAIVANLPYVADKEKNMPAHAPAHKKSLKYEPGTALYAGRHGLELYEKFFQQIATTKNKPRIIWCEIGSAYVKQTEKSVKKYFPHSRWAIKKDLAGRPRLLIIEN